MDQVYWVVIRLCQRLSIDLGGMLVELPLLSPLGECMILSHYGHPLRPLGRLVSKCIQLLILE